MLYMTFMSGMVMGLHLFKDNTLGVGGATERRRLEGSSQKSLLELLIGPTVLATMGAQLACGVKTTRLSFTWRRKETLAKKIIAWKISYDHVCWMVGLAGS
jgi:hypothetical protein